MVQSICLTPGPESVWPYGEKQALRTELAEGRSDARSKVYAADTNGGRAIALRRGRERWATE